MTGFAPTTTRADSIHADGTLIDRYGRHISYVRLSVTDRCDFRCHYCMPVNMKFLPKRDILSLDELLRVARVFAGMGVRKIRVTGGEPLVRRDIVWLCEKIAAIAGVRETAMTTNGSQLPRFAAALAAAGVRRVNVSLDSLCEKRFRALTHSGRLRDVQSGIDAALKAGFAGGVKINTVMMKGFNDDELPDLAEYALTRGMDISFIEEMPLGDIGRRRDETYYSADDAMRALSRRFVLRASDYQSGGPARYWDVEGHRNRIGFITPHSNNFCHNCNRVRVTAVGELYPCLGQNVSADLKAALRADDASDEKLRRLITRTMEIKPKGHEFDIRADNARVVRFMSATGG